MDQRRRANWFWAVVTGVGVALFAAFYLSMPWPKAVLLGLLSAALTLILAAVFGEKGSPVQSATPANVPASAQKVSSLPSEEGTAPQAAPAAATPMAAMVSQPVSAPAASAPPIPAKDDEVEPVEPVVASPVAPPKRATSAAPVSRTPKDRGGQPKVGDPRTSARAKPTGKPAAKRASPESRLSETELVEPTPTPSAAKPRVTAPAPAKAKPAAAKPQKPEPEPAATPAAKTEDKPAPRKAATTAPKPLKKIEDAPEKVDDLKQIKGIGPKIEKALHGMGVTKFSQIAAWTETDIKYFDDHINGPARIEHDDWIGQARLLAAGGMTMFASRVRKGEVY